MKGSPWETLTFKKQVEEKPAKKSHEPGKSGDPG
jgi:hypothetical protein